MNLRRLFAVLLVTLAIGAGFLAGRASADQPHMASALDHLREAKRDLEKADNDKGGHRASALRLVNDAIRQVEQGMKYDRRH
jgi:hypothetical protein